MNEFLAGLYGTSETIQGDEEDLEKNAAAEFLIKIAEAEGIDLNECSDEEIGELYTIIEGEKTAAEAETETDPDEEAQTKLAEADFLGRAMAHAYVNELDEIEKTASSAQKALFSTLKGVAKEHGTGAAVKKGLQSQGGAMKSLGRAIKSAISGKAPSAAKKGLAISAKPGESMRRTALRAAGQAARVGAPTLAGGAALTGGTALAAKKLLSKDKEKKSFNEQFEDAAAERANAFLAEQGIDTEKVAEAQLEEALDERAVEMLQEAGYEFEE